VAVLDSRLATARYRGALLARVPPMKRTLDRDEVVAFLADLAGSDATAAGAGTAGGGGDTDAGAPARAGG